MLLSRANKADGVDNDDTARPAHEASPCPGLPLLSLERLHNNAKNYRKEQRARVWAEPGSTGGSRLSRTRRLAHEPAHAPTSLDPSLTDVELSDGVGPFVVRDRAPPRPLCR